jgi:hypothetical protein
MKSLTYLIGALLMSAAAIAQVTITVYNQDLGLVKETRSIDVKKGAFTFEAADVAAQIDPTSVHLKLAGASVFEQDFEYDLVSRDRLLERYLDQSIQVFTDKGDMFEGTLLSASSSELILRAADGRVQVVAPTFVRDVRFGVLPGGLRTRPTLVWSLFGDKPSKQQAELSYLTHGINWHAEYVAVTAEKSSNLELSSWVSIDNRSGASYKDAKLKLMAGDVQVVQPPMPSDGGMRYMTKAMVANEAAPAFAEKPFFEYHLYTLDKPVTLKDRQTKQVSLFSPATVTSHREYVFDQQKNAEKVSVNLVFKNEKSEGLGLPLPAGKVRLYQRDDDGGLEFVGEDMMDHTPESKEVRLTAGMAFDLTAKQEMTDQQRISDRVWEESYKVSLHNSKKEAVEIKVVTRQYGDWKILESSLPYEKKDAFTIEFKVPVTAGKDTILTYRVRRQ